MGHMSCVNKLECGNLIRYFGYNIICCRRPGPFRETLRNALHVELTQAHPFCTAPLHPSSLFQMSVRITQFGALDHSIVMTVLIQIRVEVWFLLSLLE